jgi:hypothetical protein
MQLSAVSASLPAMRLMNVLLTGVFAIIALFAGLIVAAIGLVAFVLGRLLGRPRRGPTRVPVHQPAPARRYRESSEDVIEVTATEVPADRVSH